MRFKRIALFFILLANTLVLAHSIIPHHHHNGLVVSVDTTKPSHHGDKSFNDHSHDTDDDDADCALRKEFLTPGRGFISATNRQDEDPEQKLFQDIHNSIPIITTPVYYLSCFSFRIHNDISQYLFLLNNSQGLRAPPLS